MCIRDSCRPESRNIISDFSVVNNYISHGIYSPASGCESDILPFRRSAILTERFCIHRPFTRAIRKLVSSMLSAASQLLLLMKQRSLRETQQADFRASTKQPVGSQQWTEITKNVCWVLNRRPCHYRFIPSKLNTEILFRIFHIHSQPVRISPRPISICQLHALLHLSLIHI